MTLGLFFPVVCFIHVFDQTLAEQLYRDKDLLTLTFIKSSSLNPEPLRTDWPRYHLIMMDVVSQTCIFHIVGYSVQDLKQKLLTESAQLRGLGNLEQG